MLPNNRLLVTSFPADFVIATAVPSEAEWIQGYRGWWTNAEDTVHLALAKENRGFVLTQTEQEAAYLLSDEFWRLDDLLGVRPDYEGITDPVTELSEADRFWLVVSVSWVWAHRSDTADPFSLVEEVHADFGYPPEMFPFIRYMPAQPGHEQSLAGIERRWEHYMAERWGEYAARAEQWR